MKPQVTAADIINDPNWHLCHLDLSSYTATFAYLSRDIIDNAAFLDQRFFSNFPGSFTQIDLRLFAKFSHNRQQPINYIFHTAFCGSTLLSRCLNLNGSNLSLSEPEVLLQLAHFKRNYPDFAKSADWLKILSTVIHLLARPFSSTEKVLIKPTNSANNLIEDIIQLDTNSKALFLTSTMNEFFISNIKKGDGYVGFCELLIKCFSMDSSYLIEHSINQPEQLNNLDKAALAWHMQQDQFEKAFKRSNNNFGKTLSISDFLSQPRNTFNGLNNFFNLGLTNMQIKEILSSKAFNTHSKGESGDYNKEIKQQEDLKIENMHKSEFENAINWANSTCGKSNYFYFQENQLLNQSLS